MQFSGKGFFLYRLRCAFLVTAYVLVLGAILNGCSDIGPFPLDEYWGDTAPTWSPDGTRIAFIHTAPAGEDATSVAGLYVLDLETGSRSLVLPGPIQAPDWSPDGERIAFSAGDIFTVRPDGTNLSVVTDHGMAFFPRWSPHGTALSYGRSGSQEVVGLWFAHLDASEFIRLTRFGFGASPADWSPDGTRIVFEGPRGEAPGGNQIWVADTSGANRVQLTTNNSTVSRYAAWSPDGEWIAWLADSGIWLMRADGTEQHLLVARDKAPIYPAWSPDSERLAFSALAPDRHRSVLWTINRDGTGLRQLTH